MGLLLNNRFVQINGQELHQPLLTWLRERQMLSATKEGCAAGDCGACSVLLGRLSGKAMTYEVVNACLLPLGSLESCHLVTVEGLSDGPLHVIQQALVEHHASQCGFCTPGIVMAMLAWWLNTPPTKLETEAQLAVHRHQFSQALSGNLCRCTGYEPIFKAAASLAASSLGGDLTDVRLAGMSQADVVACLSSQQDAVESAATSYFLPLDEQQLALAFNAAPHARLICGATDTGLEVTQQLMQHEAYIDLSRLSELGQITEVDGELRIGAGVTFSQLEDYFSAHASVYSEAWLELLALIGSWQIRNRGTIGGNIANGSPIADTPPLLLALGAQLLLQQGSLQRLVPLDQFYLGYRQTALQEGEIIREIRLPSMPDDSGVYVAKISKRQEDDISAACIAMWLSKDKDRLACRIGLGGMAAIPALASKAMAQVCADNTSKVELHKALNDDFTPMDDVRASAQYRLQVCANTLAHWLQGGGQQ